MVRGKVGEGKRRRRRDNEIVGEGGGGYGWKMWEGINEGKEKV